LYQCLAKNDAGIIFSEKSDVVVACKNELKIISFYKLIQLIVINLSLNCSQCQIWANLKIVKNERKM
jgi:hypothetical protein